MSNPFSFQQPGLIRLAVVVEVALCVGHAAVRHADGFYLAGRGDARDALFQIGAGLQW